MFNLISFSLHRFQFVFKVIEHVLIFVTLSLKCWCISLCLVSCLMIYLLSYSISTSYSSFQHQTQLTLLYQNFGWFLCLMHLSLGLLILPYHRLFYIHICYLIYLCGHSCDTSCHISIACRCRCPLGIT